MQSFQMSLKFQYHPNMFRLCFKFNEIFFRVLALRFDKEAMSMSLDVNNWDCVYYLLQDCVFFSFFFSFFLLLSFLLWKVRMVLFSWRGPATCWRVIIIYNNWEKNEIWDKINKHQNWLAIIAVKFLLRLVT